jgi:leucyl aminopeptidase (aminopeptidase T)
MAVTHDGRMKGTITLGRRLWSAARVAVEEVLKARKGERILIVTNPDRDVSAISAAVYDAASDRGAAPTLIYQPVKTILDFADDSVIGALETRPDIIVSVSKEKLGKDRSAMEKPYRHRGKTYTHIFDYLLRTGKARAFWSPSVTAGMFEKTVPIDYSALRKRCDALKRILDGAEEVHMTSPRGTDLVLGLKGRKAFKDDGDFSRPGTGGNLPAGEVYVSPELEAGGGTLVYDGSISSHRGVIVIKKPITLDIKDNMITRISGGGEAARLRATLKRAEKTTRELARSGRIPRREVSAYLANIKGLGELGIGLNEKARIVGNMLEDEKVFRTCHIAIGSNYDGDAKAVIHLDGLIRNPTLRVRRRRGGWETIMEKGRLTL